MKAPISPLGKLDCLRLNKKCFYQNNRKFSTSFKGWANAKPSTPATYDLRDQTSGKNFSQINNK